MRAEISLLFPFYLFVFLALIGVMWLIFLRRSRRWKQRARHFFICRTCQQKIDAQLPRLWVRCPRCGARDEISKMKESYGNVDRS